MDKSEIKAETKNILIREQPFASAIVVLVFGTVSILSFLAAMRSDRMVRVMWTLSWLVTGAIGFFLGMVTLRRTKNTKRKSSRYIAIAGMACSMLAITFMIFMSIPALYSAAKSGWWLVSDFVVKMVW